MMSATATAGLLTISAVAADATHRASTKRTYQMARPVEKSNNPNGSSSAAEYGGKANGVTDQAGSLISGASLTFHDRSGSVRYGSPRCKTTRSAQATTRKSTTWPCGVKSVTLRTASDITAAKQAKTKNVYTSDLTKCVRAINPTFAAPPWGTRTSIGPLELTPIDSFVQLRPAARCNRIHTARSRRRQSPSLARNASGPATTRVRPGERRRTPPAQATSSTGKNAERPQRP